MRMEENTSIGPCIKIDKPTQTSSRPGERCPNPGCKNHKNESMGAKYCPLCGSMVEHYPIPQPLSIWDVLIDNDIDEDLFFVIHSDMHELRERDTTVLTDNTEYYASKNQALTADVITSSLKKFKEKFKDEIMVMENYYESVVVEFVVFTYYC